MLVAMLMMVHWLPDPWQVVKAIGCLVLEMVGAIVVATAGNLVGIEVSTAGIKVGALVAFSSTVALVGTTLRFGAEVVCPETGDGVLKFVVGAVVLGPVVDG